MSLIKRPGQKTVQTEERQPPVAPVAVQKQSRLDSLFSRINSASQKIGEFGIGFAKGVASIPAEAASLGQDIGLRAAAAVRPDVTYDQLKTAIGKQGGTASQITAGLQQGTEKTEEQFAPKTGAEKVGFGAEKIAEFFVPVGSATKIKTAGKIAELAKTSPKLAKVAGAATKIIGEGAEQAIRSSVQKGSAEDMGTDFAVGAAFPIAGKTFGVVKNQFPKIATALEKSALRLTPTQKRDLGTKIDDAVDFIKNNKIVGNPEKRFEKVVSVLDDKEDTFQKFLTENAKDRVVPKEKVIAELESLKSAYQGERDVLAIERQIDEAIATFKAKWPDEIPVERLNAFKRSTYKGAYNKAGEKVLDTVEHDIADVARRNIESATEGLEVAGKPVGEFNREYGRAINAMKFLKTAASRNQIGLVGKLLSSFVGGTLGTTIGGPVGSAVGAVVGPALAEKTTGTAVKSFLSSGLTRLSKVQSTKGINPFLKGAASQLTGD